MNEQATNPVEQKFHYQLAAVTVYYMLGDLEKSRMMNVMLRTNLSVFRPIDVANVQDQAMKIWSNRYANEKRFKNAKISDVVVTSLNYLGHMTQDEYMVGIPEELQGSLQGA